MIVFSEFIYMEQNNKEFKCDFEVDDKNLKMLYHKN